MSDEIHKNLDKLLNEDLIENDVKKMHLNISEKVEKQKKKLTQEIEKRKNKNNNEFCEIAKGLVFQFGNFEIQT